MGASGQRTDMAHPAFKYLLEMVGFNKVYELFLTEFPPGSTKVTWSKNQLARAIYRRGLMAKAFSHPLVYVYAMCYFG